MDDSSGRKISKTTVKVTTSAPTTLIRPNTKIKIKGSLSFDNPSDEDVTSPVFTIEKLQELRDNGEETPPFDSGFFGNGPAKEKLVNGVSHEAEVLNHLEDEQDGIQKNLDINLNQVTECENESDKNEASAKSNALSDDASSVKSSESSDEPLQIGIAVRKRSIDSDKESEPIVEVHHARYRCQPVYNIEQTQTRATKNYGPSVIQNTRDDSFLNRRCQSVSDRRFASMRTRSSFEKQKSFSPKTSTRSLGSDDDNTGFEKPKSAKLQAFLSMRQKNLDEGVSNFMQEENLIFKKNVGKNPVRQYPIERTYVGSASPKLHRRITIGNASAPTSGRITPTLYDPASEKKKLSEFSKALTNAVWRKKQFLEN